MSPTGADMQLYRDVHRIAAALEKIAGHMEILENIAESVEWPTQEAPDREGT